MCESVCVCAVCVCVYMCRCVMSESSHKFNIIRFHSMNFIIALTAWVCHAQIAGFS